MDNSEDLKILRDQISTLIEKNLSVRVNSEQLLDMQDIRQDLNKTCFDFLESVPDQKVIGLIRRSTLEFVAEFFTELPSAIPKFGLRSEYTDTEIKKYASELKKATSDLLTFLKSPRVNYVGKSFWHNHIEEEELADTLKKCLTNLIQGIEGGEIDMIRQEIHGRFKSRNRTKHFLENTVSLELSKLAMVKFSEPNHSIVVDITCSYAMQLYLGLEAPLITDEDKVTKAYNAWTVQSLQTE